MRRAPECIVRVVGGRSPAESAFLGTGMLVAPERVLTCNHVVREQDPWEGPTQVLIQNLWVETAAGRRVAVCQPPRLAPDLDLALLQLAEPLAADVPPFLSGLTEALVPTLQVLPLKVFGYQAPGVRTGSLIRYSINKWLVWGSSPDRGDTLSDWQLAGGLWEGLSGSPVLVAWKRQWAYVGTVYLGGTRSGTSRVIPADPVREFLAQQGLRNLPMIEATRLRARSARGLWWTVAAAALLGAGLVGYLGWPLGQPQPIHLAIDEFTLTGEGALTEKPGDLAGQSQALSPMANHALVLEIVPADSVLQTAGKLVTPGGVIPLDRPLHTDTAKVVRLTILVASGKVVEVNVHGVMTLKAVFSPEGQAAGWSLRILDSMRSEIPETKPPSQLSPVRAVPSAPPAPLRPASTTIRNPRPQFVWVPVPGAKAYRVILRSAEGATLWRTEVAANSAAYPENLVPLEAGRTFRWTVEPLGSEFLGVAEGEFRALDNKTATRLDNELKELEVSHSSEVRTIFQAAVLGAYGLHLEALELLDAVESARPWPILAERLRNRLSRELGWKRT